MKSGTVAVTEDVVVEIDESFALELAIVTSGVPFAAETARLEVSIPNTDSWGVTVTASPAEIVEGETRAVTLTARVTPGEPGEGCVAAFPITLGLAVGGEAGSPEDYTLDAAPAEMRLAPCEAEASWQVTLEAKLETVSDADETVTFTPAIVGTPAFEVDGTLIVPAAVTIREGRGVALSRTLLEFREGESATYTVALTSQPTGTVRVTPTVSGDPDIAVSPGALTFTPDTWHEAKTVTVRAAQDPDAADDDAEVHHSVTGADYGGIAVPPVQVDVRDDEGLPKTHGEVQLMEERAGPNGGRMGRLEVGFVNRPAPVSEWGTICADRRTDPGNLAPAVACRMMVDRGFTGGHAVPAPVNARKLGLPEGDPQRPANQPDWTIMPILLDDVVCRAQAGGAPPSTLLQCSHAGPRLYNCTHKEDLWVECMGTGGIETDPLPDLPALSVANAGTAESSGAPLRFAVALSWESAVQETVVTDPVTVDYATSDGSAEHPDRRAALAVGKPTAPDKRDHARDYEARSGTLTFTSADPVECDLIRNGPLTYVCRVKKPVAVPVNDDRAEDSGEVMTLTLSNPVNAQFADPFATGIIWNHEDELPGAPLKAAFVEDSLPASHDGATAFTLRLRFSVAIAPAEAAVREHGFAVTGGALTAARRVPGETGLWELTVTPSSDAAVVVAPAARACGEAGALCTADGRALSHALETTVVGPMAAPRIAGVAQVGNTLTASFGNTPGGADTPGAAPAYSWFRDGAAIAGADGASRVLTAADAGARISVRIARDGRSATSAETVPVWPAPAAPAPGADEVELLRATLTLGSHAGSPLRVAGYGRIRGLTFGDMDETGFADGDTAHAVTLLALNDAGQFAIAASPAPGDPAGLAVYWNGHRMARLEADTLGGAPVLVGETSAPRAEYLRYMDGSSDGVRVAVSLRRTVGAAAPAPVEVTGAEVTSGPGANGAWDEGETVSAAVRFSAPVTVTGPPGSTPTLAILLDGARRAAAFAGGSGTDTLTFSHTVSAADAGARKARVAPNGLALNGAALNGAGGGAVETDFAVAPWVSAAALAPDTSGDNVWTPGESVEVRLTFSEPVAVTPAPADPEERPGLPRVQVTVAGAPVELELTSGTGSETLVFAAVLPQGNPALSEIAVTANSLTPNGAAIVSAASGLAAELGHDGTAATPAPGQTGGTALTAAFLGLPAAHEGSAFVFELAFSDALADGLGEAVLRESAFTVANGRVTGARQLESGSSRRWQIAVAPDGGGDVSVTLPETADCAAPGALCTAGGGMLSPAVSVTVPESPPANGGPLPLTAAFESLPEAHDGASPTVFRIVFSAEPHGYSFRTLRDRTLGVRQGGAALAPKKVKRLDAGSNRRWEVTVEPASKADLSLSIAPTADCGAEGAVCTEDGRMLSNAVSAVIPGPPGLSVADARVREAPGAMLDFAVSLSRAAPETVRVDYATSDGSAAAGEDYTAVSGTLVFAPGETAKTVSVAVLDDSHDEDEETFTLTLSAPSGGNAWLSDATATGTIENSDAMPKAWLARFGRTVAEQVIEAVEERLRTPPRAGAEASLAGEALPSWNGARTGSGPGSGPESGSGDAAAGNAAGGTAGGTAGATAAGAAAGEAEAQARLAALSDWLQGDRREDGGNGARSRSPTPRDFLTGTSFAVTAEAAGGGLASLWGRGALTSFNGRERTDGADLTLEGEVGSLMLGADWTREAWTAGLLVAHSRGEGSYRGAGEGTVSSSVTGLYPYGRYRVNPRVTLWGVAGYGAGRLTLTPKNPEGDGNLSPLETDMDLMMAAAGVRGVALEAPADGGIELAVTSDAMMVRTSSAAVSGSDGGGNLAAGEAEVTRLRLGLEGSWRGLAFGGHELTPSAEIGLRHDGGDAETGFGADIGAGLAWSHAGSGIAAEVSARGLLTHEAGGFRDKGIAGSFAWDPDPSGGRGPRLSLTQTMGGSSRGGMDALLGRETLAGLAANDNGGDELKNRRLELKLGYGFPVFGERFMATPEFGLGLSNGQREYSLGWRLDLVQSAANALELRLEATRREAAGDDAEPLHGIGFRLTARW